MRRDDAVGVSFAEVMSELRVARVVTPRRGLVADGLEFRGRRFRQPQAGLFQTFGLMGGANT